MSKLLFGSIICMVKGLIRNNNLDYYQRAVPADLRLRLGKKTFKHPLKSVNGNVIVQCDRLNARYDALFKGMRDDPSLTPSEIKLAAIALLAHHGIKTGDANRPVPRPPGVEGDWDPLGHIEAVRDAIVEGLEEHSPITRASFEAMNCALPVLLSEAFMVYVENHPKGQNKKFEDDQKQHWNKLVAVIGDIGLEGLTRSHARRYREQRLSTGIKTSTLSREISVLRAVVNVACREIPLNLKNPFDSLSIPNMNEDASIRFPYLKDEWRQLVNAAIQSDDEPRRIVLVLAFTGARLAEVVGLRKQDFDPVTQTINIRSHTSRSLKTSASERIVPLLPKALNAVQQQFTESPTDFLFPTYANALKTSSDSASATLNKWGKKLVTSKSMHSFRHTFRDALREVMCPESISKEIGGWSATHDVSVGYGQGYPLELKRAWLTKAYARFI